MIKEKRCKNKECNKVLPERYKHKYCESCMNKQAHKVKNILGTTFAIGLCVITAGRLGKWRKKIIKNNRKKRRIIYE